MNGHELYELWLRKLDEVANCVADSWEQIEELDQEVWNAMAEELANR